MRSSSIALVETPKNDKSSSAPRKATWQDVQAPENGEVKEEFSGFDIQQRQNELETAAVCPLNDLLSGVPRMMTDRQLEERSGRGRISGSRRMTPTMKRWTVRLPFDGEDR